MKKRCFYLVFLLFTSLTAFAQSNEIVRGRVVDTTGKPIIGERVALISKNGNDKVMKLTDGNGEFFFTVNKRKLQDYAVRCYYFNESDRNQMMPLHDFILSPEYVVKTNISTSYRSRNLKYYYFPYRHKAVYFDHPRDLNEYIRSHFGMVN